MKPWPRSTSIRSVKKANIWRCLDGAHGVTEESDGSTAVLVPCWTSPQHAEEVHRINCLQNTQYTKAYNAHCPPFLYMPRFIYLYTKSYLHKLLSDKLQLKYTGKCLLHQSCCPDLVQDRGISSPNLHPTIKLPHPETIHRDS